MKYVLRKPDGTEATLTRDDLVMGYNRREIEVTWPAKDSGAVEWQSVGTLIGVSLPSPSTTDPTIMRETPVAKPRRSMKAVIYMAIASFLACVPIPKQAEIAALVAGPHSLYYVAVYKYIPSYIQIVVFGSCFAIFLIIRMNTRSRAGSVLAIQLCLLVLLALININAILTPVDEYGRRAMTTTSYQYGGPKPVRYSSVLTKSKQRMYPSVMPYLALVFAVASLKTVRSESPGADHSNDSP